MVERRVDRREGHPGYSSTALIEDLEEPGTLVHLVALHDFACDPDCVDIRCRNVRQLHALIVP